MKVQMLDDDTVLHVYSDEMYEGVYIISDHSVFKDIKNDSIGNYIENIEDFENTKKSKYYDLFLDIEMFKDRIV